MIAESVASGPVLFIAILAVYLLPTWVAIMRGVPHMGSVLVINLFLGWTLVGWVVALAMAARTVTREPQAPLARDD